ncbi:MAG: hypothetical protein AAF791_14620 [Bacteroidota bacterium]
MPTLTLTLTDEQARRLRDRAAARGLSTEAYVAELADQEDGTTSAGRLDELIGRVPRPMPVLPRRADQREFYYSE